VAVNTQNTSKYTPAFSAIGDATQWGVDTAKKSLNSAKSFFSNFKAQSNARARARGN
jgi:hypothetical protein